MRGRFNALRPTSGLSAPMVHRALRRAIVQGLKYAPPARCPQKDFASCSIGSGITAAANVVLLAPSFGEPQKLGLYLYIAILCI